MTFGRGEIVTEVEAKAIKAKNARTVSIEKLESTK